MSGEEEKYNEQQSTLDKSSETQRITDIFSSTMIQDEEKEIKIDPEGRKTMYPSQFVRQNDKNSVEINSHNALSHVDKKLSEEENRNKTRAQPTVRFNVDINTIDSRLENSRVKLISHKETQTEVDNSHIQIVHEKSDNLNSKCDNNDNRSMELVEIESESNDDSFDAFILKNFVSFSGKEDVNKWLDITETKFNNNCIGRNLRFAAISLLVEGDAKRKYIDNRNAIRTFDDFYELLVSEFDRNKNTSNSDKNFHNINSQSSSLTVSSHMRSTIEPNQSYLNNSKTLHMTDQEPLFSSTKDNHDGVADSIGDKPVIKQSAVSNILSNSVTDPTLNDLRKAIVSDFIKNPKTFKGGRDDVKKWIEDIEHLFDIADISEPTRLNLISYSLRGDALEWFKNNKTSFRSWDVFVTEVKRAFTSSFYEELAFKKLEAYSQGENQSISSFYHDVLKLCKEADSKMTEATKLKHLLSKTKRSVQFEVRKKKPISLTEYLEFAKEAEELIQLSNMTPDTADSSINAQPVYHHPKVSSSSDKTVSWNQSQNRSSNNNSSSYFRNYNKDNSFSNNSNNSSNRHYSSSSNERTPREFRSNNNSSATYQKRPNPQFTGHNNKKDQSARNNPQQNTRVSTTTANTVDMNHPLTNTSVSQEGFSYDNNSQCDQFGQETSVRPNF
jgi:hypothetical protein